MLTCKSAMHQEVCQLVKMRVCMREIEAVYFRTREDQHICERRRYTLCSPAVGNSNRELPDTCRDLVIRKDGLIAPERRALGVVGHAAPQLEPHGWAPCGLAIVENPKQRHLESLPDLLHRPIRPIDYRRVRRCR